jgi:hypothetical protein
MPSVHEVLPYNKPFRSDKISTVIGTSLCTTSGTGLRILLHSIVELTPFSWRSKHTITKRQYVVHLRSGNFQYTKNFLCTARKLLEIAFPCSLAPIPVRVQQHSLGPLQIGNGWSSYNLAHLVSTEAVLPRR